jgi:hypothetical protein
VNEQKISLRLSELSRLYIENGVLRISSVFKRIFGRIGGEGMETEDGRISTGQQHSACCPVTCVCCSADL